MRNIRNIGGEVHPKTESASELRARAFELEAEAASLKAEAATLKARAERTESVPQIPTYTTSTKAPMLPVGKSRDWCCRHFPAIPGAYKLGHAWCISVTDFESWAKRGVQASGGAPTPAPAAEPSGWSLDAALESAGIRRLA